MKNTQKLIKLFCLAVSFALILSACGNSSYNDRSLILSNEDSYSNELAKQADVVFRLKRGELQVV